MTTIVPTGCFEIHDSQKLKVYLASCVGLGLYDNKKRYGGILHILLPEPISEIPLAEQTYYASTGVPVFIEHMKNMGSREEDMVAFIAGGAIIDTYAKEDYCINIGSRTIEITMDLLKKYNIPIKNLETSGVTPFCMIMDTNKGTCSIDPIFMESSVSRTHYKRPRMDDISATIGKLLPIPQITLHITSMFSDEDYDISAITQEIKKDQVLSARILKICNSSYVGLLKNIESIDQAVIYLGSKTMLQMIVTAQVNKFISSSDKGYSLCRGGMFHHALATARLSEQIAILHGLIRPDVAYTSGLLHDIGKVVLDQYISGAQPLFYRLMREKQEDSQIIEQEILGMDHNQVGLLLAESWNLPDVIKDAILFHHTPECAKENREITHIVYIADILSNRFMSGLEIEHISSSSLKKSLELLGLKPDQIFQKISIFKDIFQGG